MEGYQKNFGNRRLAFFVAAAFAMVAFAAAALAGDVITADGDRMDPGIQNPDPIGTVAAGQSIARLAKFTLTCQSQQHVDAGDSITLTYSAANSTIPSGGSLSATNSSISRPSTWPADGTACANPPQTASSTNGNDSNVSITAPTTPGNYTFVASYTIGGTGIGASDITGNKVDVTYTLTVDSPPTVASTSPGNGAGTGSNITVTFSEPVSTTGNPFSVSCATSGSHTLSVSGGPTTWTLDPATDFVANELCAVTVTASKVKDVDTADPPDNLAADYQFSFTTDSAPSISSTTPANHATGAARNANIVLTFSENVNLAAGGYSISCGSGPTNHTAAISGNGSSSITLDPATDFAYSETCTVTINANGVTDNDTGDPPDNMTAAYVFDFTTEASPNTPPTVSVTGVSNGATYEIGSVPAAGCSVTDAEDSLSNSTTATTPTVGAVTGPNAAYGIGSQMVTCSYTDGGGETRGASATYTIVDTLNPVVACDPADGLWHGSDALVHCSAVDTGSGLAVSGDGSFNLTTNVAANTETNNASTDSHQVCDHASNCVTAGPVGGNQVDKKAPSINCASADGNWHPSDVSIACTASDGGSGLASSDDAGFSLTTNVASDTETNNASTGTRDVADAVGNSATAGPVNGNKVDKKAPTATCDPAPSAWSANDVTRGCSAIDGGSGLANAGDASFSLKTNVANGTETANALTDSKLLTDAVGNSRTIGPLDGNQVDKKAPSVNCGSADGNWHPDDVSITCTAGDGGSGLADSADASFNLSTNVADGTETATASTESRSVADAVGNSATAGPVTGNKVDKKAPQLTGCDSADTAWHATDVTLHCHYTDGGSGPATQDVDLTTDVAAGTETSNALASAGTSKACDEVGNCAASPTDISGNKIDKKAPQLSSCDTPDGAWHAADVTLQCHYTDGGSGPAAQNVNLATNVAAGTETDNAFASAGASKACDGVGNCAASPSDIAGNKIDKKDPTFSCDAAPAAWSATDVTRNCTAEDGGSGIAPATDAHFSLSTNVANGTETADALTGSKTINDGVGHSVTAGPLGGNKVDKKGPVVTCNTPAPSFLLNQPGATVNGTFTDGGSGPASGSTSSPANTSSAGGKTVTLSKTDNVGNVGNAPCGYTVGYRFDGFYAPVDKPNTMNVSKAGQAVPLKWRLTDYNNAPFSNLTTASIAVGTLSCTASSGVFDDIETYAGESGLQNLGDGYYQWNWKSPMSYASSCKQIGLNLGEGSVRTGLAYFNFKK